MSNFEKTLEEIKDINKKNHNEALENYKKIQADINNMKDVIIKNLIGENKKLHDKIKNLEKKCTIDIESNNQYVRRNNIEISGIPNKVEDNKLEGKVIEILKGIEVEVGEQDIEACHRLPTKNSSENKKTIVRFVNRKKCEKV